MQGGSSRINREEQVKVVVRLRPDDNEKYSKCVYLSEQDQNELVVEAANRREIFQFDHVASESASQLDVYRMIAQECVQHTLQGFNCCIFAYGQTGAGKTYSVLGSLADLTLDPYAESRGILPRLLEELCEAGRERPDERQNLVFSYMEIYNQQIFDLLSPDKRIHQIRQDAKKGVFVEGLTERRATSYKAAVGLLLQGQRTRRMASTLMNSESSRSHAIFTVGVESEVVQEEVVRVRRAKLHVVDLAGSERVKHTNVEGERLRQGCSINKSLHVLGNVINSLVESAKKKKHVPYRDSKLTHYLKDSLAGNSITKLLANVHTSRNYFGDTLSTLMFAKRAKILKMKVELNETSVGNFDALRKEVRRLREELAQARYFKNDSKTLDRSSSEGELQVSLEPEVEVIPQKEEMLKTLEENETHFKALMEIYQEHMKTCLTSSHLQRKQNINIVGEWKNLERRNIALTNILRRLPAFTSIYRQNLLLRKTNVKGIKSQPENQVQAIQQQAQSTPTHNSISPQKANELLENTINFYEKAMIQSQGKFRECLETLQRSYFQLEGQCRQKQQRIRDLKKRREYPPDIQELKNENQYLHLSILNLEDEIAKLQQNEQRLRVEMRQISKNSPRKSDSREQLEEQDDFEFIYSQLLEIRGQALREAQMYDVQRSELHLALQKAQAEITRLIAQVGRLRARRSKSKSKHRTTHNTDIFLSPDPHLHPQTTTPRREEMLFSSKTIKFENDELKSLQQNFTKEVLVLKMEIKRKQKEIIDLRDQLEKYANGDRKIQQEFGKPLHEIIEDYRKVDQRKTLVQSRSVKVLQQWREDTSRRTSRNEEAEKIQKKLPNARPPDPKREDKRKVQASGK